MSPCTLATKWAWGTSAQLTIWRTGRLLHVQTPSRVDILTLQYNSLQKSFASVDDSPLRVLDKAILSHSSTFELNRAIWQDFFCIFVMHHPKSIALTNSKPNKNFTALTIFFIATSPSDLAGAGEASFYKKASSQLNSSQLSTYISNLCPRKSLIGFG